MPFTKTSHGKYVSPSGRKWTKKQVIAYYASDGFKKKKLPKISRPSKRRPRYA